jgi:hypothetical protein
MIRKKKEKSGPMIIDITGPDGNAFVLMGYAARLSDQLGWSRERFSMLRDEMMSGDYENLLQVFDREFGDFVILER